MWDASKKKKKTTTPADQTAFLLERVSVHGGAAVLASVGEAASFTGDRRWKKGGASPDMANRVFSYLGAGAWLKKKKVFPTPLFEKRKI